MRSKTTSAGPRWPTRLIQDHVRAIDDTVGRLRRHPVGTLLTLLVIGITLALPTALEGLIHDFSGSGHALGRESLKITLFLKDAVSEARGKTLTHELSTQAGIASSRYISKHQALDEFEQNAHAGTALKLLDSNPLPASIVVIPHAGGSEAEIEALLKRLSAVPEVAQAQFDQRWLRRLYALFRLAGNILLGVTMVLALTVVIIIGNTIRLDIENRREEIEVMKLVGAPNHYVRRRFLYAGVCYGLGGALLAFVFVEIGLWLLGGALQNLAAVYDTHIEVAGLDFDAFVLLLGCGIVLGWLGAFWTVSRHLHRIEPE